MTEAVVEPTPDPVDVVVVGSGAAGLTAALAAAVAGATVTVLEAADVIGGTTSISGGAIWLPGRSGDLAEARTYCHEHGATGDLVDAFLDAAPQAARFLQEHSPIRLVPMRYPDSFADGPGGRGDRNVEVAPLPGDLAGVGWPAGYPMVLTNDELHEYRPHAGGALPSGLYEDRTSAGAVTMGLGLVSGLLQGCRLAGARVLTGRRAERLLADAAGRVTGVAGGGPAASGGPEWTVPARHGVVLATGGFEHDTDLVAALHRQPVCPLSPPTNRGDGWRLAAAVGAQVVDGDLSWRWPATQVPGQTWDAPFDSVARPRMLFAERSMPHSIWVNGCGRRFVNEAGHNSMLALDEVDPETNRRRNVPAFAICDARFRDRYTVAGHGAGEAVPPWLTAADTLADLAARAGIGPHLEATVARFNAAARAGADPEFGRGSTAYDRFTGDPDAAHPNLGEIAEPPFFAVPVRLGVVGTKGGPRTDRAGRVLGWSGAPVPGLYAAGNVAAAVIGPGTLANGSTLGVAVTFGWLAGSAAIKAR